MYHAVDGQLVTMMLLWLMTFILPATRALKVITPKVLNPLTNRQISLTSIRTKSTFSELVHQKGGLIAHNGKLVELFQKEQSDIKSVFPIESWYRLDTTITLIEHDDISILPKLNELLLVHKPSGLLTLPGRSEPDCLSERVLTSLSSSEFKDGFIPRPCHRLDLDTSGVIAIGLTRDSYRAMSYQFEHRIVQKTYVALVDGILESNHGTVDLAIGKVTAVTGYTAWTCAQGNHVVEPREAKTQWRVSKRYDKHTRVELLPTTGRGHQLRLHMEALGHSILGDTLHSNERVAGSAPRLCLHAEQLQFLAQVSGSAYQVTCESVAPF